MSILKIARIGNPILLKKASKIEKIPDPEIVKIVNDMAETMIDANGVGLAAPQVYISKQIIVYRNPDIEKKKDKEIEIKDKEIKINVLINPRIIQTSNETDNKWEGCLSIPGMTGLVKRHSEIEYEASDINGKLIRKKISGLHARIIQHEFDHLVGILYINKLADQRAYGFENEIEKYWQNNNEEN